MFMPAPVRLDKLKLFVSTMSKFDDVLPVIICFCLELMTWVRGHDSLVTDLLRFVWLLKFSVQNSGVMSASSGAFFP